eukprot:2129918-Alexandrium_andersonii.AAC.1
MGAGQGCCLASPHLGPDTGRVGLDVLRRFGLLGHPLGCPLGRHRRGLCTLQFGPRGCELMA